MIYLTEYRRRAVLTLEDPALDPAQPGGFEWLRPGGALGPLSGPAGLALDAGGRLAVADSGNHRVVLLDGDAGGGISLDASASPAGALRNPTAVAFTAGGALVIADTGNHRLVFAGQPDAPEWSAFGTPGAAGPGTFKAPAGVHVDGAGRILAADPGANRLVRIDSPDGAGWTELPLPPGLRTPRPYALAAGPDGGVLVTDLLNSRVLLLAADDTWSILIDGSADRSLVAPVGAAFAPGAGDGDAGSLYVADAAAAALSRWTFDPVAAAWTCAARLDGRGRTPGAPAGGPEFASLTGLAVKEAS